MFVNTLKKKLYSGEYAIGTFAAYATPEIIEVVGISKMDFVVIDCEHGPSSVEATTNLIRAAEVRGLTPIVRVTYNSVTNILRSLDVGAHGIQVPQVNCKADAKKVVESSKYYPEGNRGVAIPRVIDFGTVDLMEAYRKSNNETLTVVHCETIECFENLDEILKVEGIDVVFLGPFDMSQSLKIPQQFEHPKMIEIIETVAKKTKLVGKIPGIYAANAEQAKLRIEQGYQYVTIGMVETLLAQKLKEIVFEVNK